MRKFQITWTFAVLALAPFLASADEPKTKTKPEAQAGTIVLFDGAKGLEGWKKTDFEHAGDVAARDGRMVLAAGRPMTGVTATRKDILRTNYELSYEAMRLEGGDFFAAATFPVGKSCVTLINGGWGGFVTGLSSLNGMDASENETTCSIEYKNNQWYHFRVHVTGRVVRCWLDGKEVIAVAHEDKHVGTRVETRPCEPLGFAAWKTAGAVRNVSMRPLTAAEAAADDRAVE